MPNSARILEGAPYIDNIVEFDKFEVDNGRDLVNPRRVVAALRSLLSLRLAHYDAFAIFHHPTTRMGAWERALLALAVNARATSGLESALPYAKVFTRMLTHHSPDLVSVQCMKLTTGWRWRQGWGQMRTKAGGRISRLAMRTDRPQHSCWGRKACPGATVRWWLCMRDQAGLVPPGAGR